MNNCCVCLEDTDDCYDCSVCKECNLCWDCYAYIHDYSYSPCPICRSNLNHRDCQLALTHDFERITDYRGIKTCYLKADAHYPKIPVFKKLLNLIELELI
jgi:hypothetical protein